MTLVVQKMPERPVEQGRAKKGKTEWRTRRGGEEGQRREIAIRGCTVQWEALCESQGRGLS